MAGGKTTKSFEGKYEILSLEGTLSLEGLHLHTVLSDEQGNVVGGHLKEGCIINSTAEVIIGTLEDIQFTRDLDKNTGYRELKVCFRKQNERIASLQAIFSFLLSITRQQRI